MANGQSGDSGDGITRYTGVTGTKTIVLGASRNFDVTMTGGTAFTFTASGAAIAALTNIILRGSYTPTFTDTIKWIGGTPTFSGSLQLLTMYWDGTEFVGQAAVNLT